MRLPIGSHVEWFCETRKRLMTGMIIAYENGMFVEADDKMGHVHILPPGFRYRACSVKSYGKIGLERRRECEKWVEGRS